MNSFWRLNAACGRVSALLLVPAAVLSVWAQQPAGQTAEHPVILLWAEGAPGSEGKAEAIASFLSRMRGYRVAEWLSQYGIAAFVLK